MASFWLTTEDRLKRPLFFWLSARSTVRSQGLFTVAIIKTGEFETFQERDPGGRCSLGDVVRTTPLLSLFAHGAVDWYTSLGGAALLRGTPGIRRVIEADPQNLGPLDFVRYDLIVCLERGTAWGRALAEVARDRVIGFHAEPGLRAWESQDRLSIAAWKAREIASGRPHWQDWLFALFGRKWAGEPYRIRPIERRPLADIGLNWKVGEKWPNKGAPMEAWNRVHDSLARQYRVSWQRGFQDLDQYMEWIASCRLLVSQDSLGMHLALAIGVPVVALFGASSAREVSLYDLGEIVPFAISDGRFDEEQVAAVVHRWLRNAKGRSRIARPPLLEFESRT